MYSQDNQLAKFTNNRLKELNIYNLISQSMEEWKTSGTAITSQIVSNLLKRKNYQWIPCFYNKVKLFCSNVENTREFEQLFFSFSQIKQEIGVLHIWNSQIGYYFFRILQKTKWEIQGLIFTVCSIRDIFPFYFDCINVKIIKVLHLVNNPISNRGISKLLKLPFEKLENFRLINTDCTTDIIKRLNKRMGLYYKIEVFNNNAFEAYVLEKDAYHLLNRKQKQEILFASKGKEKNPPSHTYVPYLSKVKVDGSRKAFLLGTYNEKSTIVSQMNLISFIPLHILQEVHQVQLYN